MTLTTDPIINGYPKADFIENVLGSWLGSFFISGFTTSVSSNKVRVTTGQAILLGHYVEEGAATYDVPFVAGGAHVWLQLTRDGNDECTGARYLCQSATPADAVKVCDYTDDGSFVLTVTDARGILLSTIWPSGFKPNAVPTSFSLPSDTPTINGTTSTGLAVALLPNNKYRFHALMWFHSTVNLSLNLQVHALASGAALVWVGGKALESAIVVSAGNDVVGIASAVTTNIFPSNFGLGGPTEWLAEVDGVLTVGGTATTLQLDVVSDNVNDRVKAGSWVEATPVA